MVSEDQNHVNWIVTIKQFYAGLNRGDIPAVLKLLDPEIVRVETESFPTPGTYRGLDEMKAHIEKGRSTWAEGGCEPERFTVVDDKVVVFVHVRVRLKDKTDWIDGRIADVFTLKDGKITEMRSFIDREEAMQWAGYE
ncbi:nuclear transport factor 2 family protein [Bdellovibrio sp. HCB274]|uniref:nuclear transport factor 2 family protein n=1 Tax=Bdellovibrio sp. HCB274 TaxID=3394361 RepID=UPI0039B4F807